MWFGGALEPFEWAKCSQHFSPQFSDISDFSHKIECKNGLFAKTEFAELIVYKKATFWALTGPKWTKNEDVLVKNVRHIV